MTDPTPNYSDRLALAVCSDQRDPCRVPCDLCCAQSAAVAAKLAQILRERHGGSSTVADWLDGMGCHPGTVQQP